MSAKKGGKYTKARLAMLKSVVELNKIRNTCVPYLFRHSDSQDLIIRCTNILHAAIVFNLQDFFYKIDDRLAKIKPLLDEDLVPKEIYFQTVKKTGLELDRRREVMKFIDAVAQIGMKNLNDLVRNLPGLEDCTDIEIYRRIFYHASKIQLFCYVAGEVIFGDDTITLIFDSQRQLTMNKSYLKGLAGDKRLSIDNEIFTGLNKIKITYEEAVFILALGLLTPKKIDRLTEIHNRMTLAFTRYLETTYGQYYSKRLLDLINFCCFFDEKYQESSKWSKDNSDYLEYLHKDGSITYFLMNYEFDEFVNNFNKAKLDKNENF